MALFRSFSEYLFELKDSVGTPSKNGVVIWSNGRIFFDTPIEKISPEALWDSLRFRYDTEKQTVECQPMDDWADTKIVRKLQQSLSDLRKIKFLTDEWKVIVGNEELTERSFGSLHVKDIIEFNAHYTVKIPIAFHGTTDLYEKDILEKGILSRTTTKQKKNWDKGYTKKSSKLTYFTTDYDRAVYYAGKAVKTMGGNPIVFEIHDIPISWAEADDDFTNNVSMMQLLLAIKGKKAKNPLISSIRSSGQFSVNHKIDPKMIVKKYTGEDL
jgi:hypothetical protein